MTYRSLDDIEKDKQQEKTDKLVKDINYVIDGVLKPAKKEKRSYWWLIAKIVLVSVLIATIFNLILGNVWLLRFFAKELFGFL